jgi:phosphoglycerate dehydrogenase-like enzyme
MLAEASSARPVVVALGEVDPALVTGVLGDTVTFVPQPNSQDLAVAVGAIVRADVAVDAELLDRTPRMRVLARTGVGTDLVDLAAASSRGIAVVITPGSGTRAVAEGVMAHTLHLIKRISALTALVREGRWAQRNDPAVASVGDLDGATMGIIGYGRIGGRVGTLATAFGMRVLAHDPVTPPPDEVNCPDLGELIASSDILTLHAPLTEQTLHMVNADFLSRTRRGAILINCGRGGLLDLDAALAALQSGQLGGVGLDVFEPEPPKHHPIFDHPNVSLTPHLMGLTRRATATTFSRRGTGCRRCPRRTAPSGGSQPRLGRFAPVDNTGRPALNAIRTQGGFSTCV